MAERPGDRAMEVREHRAMLARMGEEAFDLARRLDEFEFDAAVVGSLISEVERLGRILDGVLRQEQLRIDLLAPPPGEEG